MSYTKQNFIHGQVLTVENLKHIENGILDAETQIRGVPRGAYNILDNSDFRAGRFINQHGQTTYTNTRADRWYPNGAETSLIVNNGYVTMSNQDSSQHGIQQRFAGHNFSGKTLTAAIQLRDGTLIMGSAAIPAEINTNQQIILAKGNNFEMRFWQYTDMDIFTIYLNSKTSIDVLWVALYEDEYTAENLPAYVYKGYVQELLECQRYYQTVVALVGSSAGAPQRLFITLPVPMRVIPSITYTYTDGSVAPTSCVLQSENVLDITASSSGYTHLTARLSAEL